jgi:acetylornithine deacetylase/succinyl-diaminopimelate desuccinylase-like protein
VIDPHEFVADDADRILTEWGRIALVPAPLGGEQRRAALIAELAAASGADPQLDRAGNVVATIDGDDADGAAYTFLATMDDLDTVAAHRAASDRLERDGDRLVGPATETTSSDATALAIVRFARRTSRPWRRLTVAWVLGEETGLTGVRALIADRATDLGAVVDLMGGIGTVSWNAIGFAGLEVEFSTAPRHTLYGGVSEVSDAIARFVTELHADPFPVHGPPFDADPLTARRVNRIGAGSVFNHSPATGVVGVDLRSTDADVLSDIEAATRAIAERAAAAAHVDVTIRDGERQPAIQLRGGRDHYLVRSLAQAIRDTGHEPVLRAWSSSNVNVCYAAGLEGVVHDGTHRGGGRGTADEWTYIPGVLDGIEADCRLLNLLGARTTDRTPSRDGM